MKRLGLAVAFYLSLAGSVFAQGGMGPGPGTVHSTGGGGGSCCTLDGHATNTMTGGSSGTVTLTTTSTNDIIVLGVMCENNGGAVQHVTGVSDTAGLTWASRAAVAGFQTGDAWMFGGPLHPALFLPT